MKSCINVWTRNHAYTVVLAILTSSACWAQNNDPSLVATQAPQSSTPDLQVINLMSEQEFKECGLSKLTKEERDKLNQWLRRYTLTVAAISEKGIVTTASPSKPVSPTGNVIESQIDGEFEGWSGDTIFKLTNGQIWQQAAYAYSYHYAYRPKVIIYKGESGYMMKVSEMDDPIKVKLLTSP